LRYIELFLVGSLQDRAREDYWVMLREGSAQRRLSRRQHREWRKEIRRQARADRIKVRTFASDPPLLLVAAYLVVWQITDEDRRQAMQRLDEAYGGFLRDSFSA
jgi:hypothetical protein